MNTKACLISVATAISLSASAFAYPITAKNDPCRAKAIAAAQQDYGNDPFRTTIETVAAGQSYKVTVGYGNPEDGPHLYDVTFANGCSGDAVSNEAPEVAINALQNDTHTVYNKLISFNTDLPASSEVSSSDLPAKAQKGLVAVETNFKNLLASWAKDGQDVSKLELSFFKIQVDGQDTFAVVTPVLEDSIREDFYVVDSKGNEIDSGSVYSDSSVGDNGVSWQDESEQK